ncbi:MAG: hypothetical protein A2Y12_15355 [Planctomycetes bacterium GWF2_42_9]|nr:MAG: hypothetical protein A2Y12_15355 [Planctomycetes bacterium GWF2_42_9]
MEMIKKVTRTADSILIILLCFVLSGCNEEAKRRSSIESQVNVKQVELLNDIAMENAIITQRTLYPYHFIEGSEQLNELGRRDLSVLIGHFKKYPGQLNLRDDGTSAAIYETRVAYITKEIENAGVDMSKVSIANDMPGGSAMPSDDVVQIQDADRKVRYEERINGERLSYEGQ